MQNNGSSTLYAGGLLLFLGFIAGSVVGIATNQPSLGAMAGVAVASVIAALLWWRSKG